MDIGQTWLESLIEIELHPWGLQNNLQGLCEAEVILCSWVPFRVWRLLWTPLGLLSLSFSSGFCSKETSEYFASPQNPPLFCVLSSEALVFIDWISWFCGLKWERPKSKIFYYILFIFLLLFLFIFFYYYYFFGKNIIFFFVFFF